MSDEVLVRERHGNVLLVRLNRPEKRNALNFALMEALGRAVLDAEADVAIGALVVTGTGDRSFCAGMDLAEFAAGGASTDREAMDAFTRFLDRRVQVPVVGAANATAVAGGLEVLLGCDVVVASSSARFGLPEVQRGLIPGGGGTTLARRIPLAIASELLLTGDAVDAARAYQVGLVNRVVEPERVVPEALDLAGRIAANGPLALAAVKELVELVASDDVRYRARLGELRTAVMASEDAREGATAFVEKRPPVWQGR